MTSDRARKQAIRARMAETGEPYSVAARHLDTDQAPTPTPAETAQATLEEDIPQAELGITALPADSTPEQRARAEAVWRPQPDPALPCRCSGTGCHHGEPCEEAEDDEEPCTGRLVHVDRYPGGIFSPTIWEDVYVCSDTETGCTSVVDQPDLSWGAPREGGGIVIYDDVRHPNFPESHPGYEEPAEHPSGDGTCRGCGGYAFTGLLCDSCRIEGWTDSYGEVEALDHDEDDFDEYLLGPVRTTDPLRDRTRLQIGSTSDQGPRPNQSDAAHVHQDDSGAWAAAVIDGYGTHPGVPDAARQAARTAAEEGARHGARQGLLVAGSTLTRTREDGWPEPDCVGALVATDANGLTTLAWTGDVRVYTLHAYGAFTEAHQVTHDHTQGQELREAFADGAAFTVNPADYDHRVTTTLGQLPQRPHIMGTHTPYGSRNWVGVLITSDGLHDALDHDQLTELVAHHPDPDECAAALIAAARAADAERDEEQAVADNATALVIRFPVHEDQEVAERQEEEQQPRRLQLQERDERHEFDSRLARSRERLATRGYGLGTPDGDADTVAAVEAALGEDPTQVTEIDRTDLRRLKATLSRTQ